jgi:hypothetical protein
MYIIQVSLVEGGEVMIDYNEVKNPAREVQVSLSYKKT